MKAYCVFCKTGKEQAVAENINKVMENFRALVPTKIIKERRKGKWEDKEKIMLPGYIFIYSEYEIDEKYKDKVFNVIKILQYENGSYELMGSDYSFAMWIYNNYGTIETSEVMTVGDSVRIISGPLLDISGKVVKYDKHKKRIWIEIDFFGQTRNITLSAESIERI